MHLDLNGFGRFFNHIVQLRYSQRAHTHTPMNTRTQIYPYEHLLRLSRQIFEITKSSQAPRCRRERRLPLNAQHR